MIRADTMAQINNREVEVLVSRLRSTHQLCNDDIVIADQAYKKVKEWASLSHKDLDKWVTEQPGYRQVFDVIWLLWDETYIDGRSEGFRYLGVTIYTTTMIMLQTSTNASVFKGIPLLA
jgi:hypothetical protein